MQTAGLLSESEARDMLLSRANLWRQVDAIPAHYEGFVGATVDGRLLFATDESAMIAKIEAAMPPGRPGFYTFVFKVSNDLREKSASHR